MDLKTFINNYSPDLESISENPNFELQVLIAHHLGKSRSWVLAHLDEPLSDEMINNLALDVDRLTRGVPLPYILGKWEFYGHQFFVTPQVLIPRPETEQMVEKVLDWITIHPETQWIWDVGTGSGCIAISLALAFPKLKIVATDISISALRVAQKNIYLHHVAEQVFLIQTDLLPALANPPDIICANLPYVSSEDLKSLEIAEKEPLIALEAGEDGLAIYRRLLDQLASRATAPHFLLCEIDPYQIYGLDKVLERYFPFSRRQVFLDLSGFERVYTVEFGELRKQ